MKYTQKAIELASQKGFSPQDRIHANLLNPAFWRALGESMEWGEAQDIEGNENTPDYATWVPFSWGWYQCNFMDFLASGGEIEVYFEQLLTD